LNVIKRISSEESKEEIKKDAKDQDNSEHEHGESEVESEPDIPIHQEEVK